MWTRFFTIYANIDGWSPTNPEHAGRLPRPSSNLLDRWLLSELNLTVQSVRRALDAYMSYDAALALIELAESLSNWYVRRSRSRFWRAGLDQDKRDAFATLHEALSKLSLLIAPFVPFMSEEMYQKSAGFPGSTPRAAEKRAPGPLSGLRRRPSSINAWSKKRAPCATIVSLGLSVRTANKLKKVRQPLERSGRSVQRWRALLQRLAAITRR